MKYFFIILYIILITTSCKIEESYPEAEWTLIFYLADGTYSPIGLTADIKELTLNKVDTSNIRLTILYDGPKEGDSKLEILDSPFSKNSRIVPISQTNIPTMSNNELDMSAQETFESYLRYAKRKLPSKNYALYFGSHGTGFKNDTISGLQVEGESYSKLKLLTINEISDGIYNQGGVRLVTFDACNIGNIETIYEFKDSGVEYIVASPELIPGSGNNYINFISAAYNLKETTTSSLGNATLQAHYTHYSEEPTENNSHNAKSLQHLYNVTETVNIIESDNFKKELPKLLDKIEKNTTLFNYDDEIYNTNPNYSDIYKIYPYQEQLNRAITVADSGEYTWLSIYTPSIYNPEYRKTKFAILHPEWVELIKNQ